MADSTRAMRRSIFERDLLPVWRNRLLTEITPNDLRAHCAKIVGRGTPATAIQVRDILKQIYGFAILHGERVANLADVVGPASIANFVPRDRALSPTEIRVMLKMLEQVGSAENSRGVSLTHHAASSGIWRKLKHGLQPVEPSLFHVPDIQTSPSRKAVRSKGGIERRHRRNRRHEFDGPFASLNPRVDEI